MVIVEPMPSGVEHKATVVRLLGMARVIVEPMPSGVEHTPVEKLSARVKQGDRRADALGR